MSSRIQRPALLILIRHAESARNRAKKGSTYFPDDEERTASGIHGIPDHKIPITDLGVRQALATGKVLRKRFGAPDYWYHSGYARTIETTDHLMAAYLQRERRRIKVRAHASVRERDPGFAYDMTTKEANAAFPYLAEHWKTFGGFLARPPGGESLADVATNRVHPFLGMLFRDRPGQKIFVTTHGGTIRCFRFLLERWSYDQALTFNGEEKPDNCGVTVYEYDKKLKRLALREYNAVFPLSE